MLVVADASPLILLGRLELLEVVDVDSEAQEALQATLRGELDLGEAAAIALANPLREPRRAPGLVGSVTSQC